VENDSHSEIGISRLDTPRSIKFWILGPIRTPGPALPLCKKGLPALGLVHLVLFQWLTRFYLFILLAALRGVLGPAATHREMLTHSRMWQGERLIMPPTRKCGLGEREQARCAVRRAVKARETPPRSRSSGKGEEEREITLPP
jgi:hypothetical protein